MEVLLEQIDKIDYANPNHPVIKVKSEIVENCLNEGGLPIFSTENIHKLDGPIIGVTMARIEGDYVCRLNFQKVINQAGGNCVFLPAIKDQSRLAYVDYVDGVVLSGGGDIHPRNWGSEIKGAGLFNQVIDELRDEVEIEIVKKTTEDNKPLLGVCRGLQVINVAYGGSLLQDPPSAIYHMRGEKYDDMVRNFHTIMITRLDKARLKGTTKVNSGHHMSIYEVGKGLRVGAIAYDRTVESIEAVEDQFILGVQWHPEAMVESEITKGLFASLVQAAKR